MISSPFGKLFKRGGKGEGKEENLSKTGEREDKKDKKRGWGMPKRKIGSNKDDFVLKTIFLSEWKVDSLEVASLF